MTDHSTESSSQDSQQPIPQRWGERSFSLLLVVFSTTAFWQSYTISGFTGLATPGVFPMLASATMLISSICILAQSLLQSRELNTAALAAETGQTKVSWQGILPQRLLIVVVLITVYIFAMPLLGFLLSSAAFLFLSFSYLWRKSFLSSLLITVVSVALVYLVFRKLFQVVLPKGTLLQGWF